MKLLPHYWTFVRGIHRSTVGFSSQLGQLCRDLILTKHNGIKALCITSGPFCGESTPVTERGQQCVALLFSSLLFWPRCWTNNSVSGDLRRHCARSCDVRVFEYMQHCRCRERMKPLITKVPFTQGFDLLVTSERPENWPGRSSSGRPNPESSVSV